jgi:hypothetical protein
VAWGGSPWQHDSLQSRFLTTSVRKRLRETETEYPKLLGDNKRERDRTCQDTVIGRVEGCSAGGELFCAGQRGLGQRRSKRAVCGEECSEKRVRRKRGMRVVGYLWGADALW